MAAHISLIVNGRTREADVEPRRLLVQLIREDFDLTGTPHRLRYLAVRRVHRDRGRQGDQVVHDARRSG